MSDNKDISIGVAPTIVVPTIVVPTIVVPTIVVPTNIKQIMQQLIDNDFEVYIIGGFVRDSILKHNVNDIDLFTNATGKQILNIFPNGIIIGNEERQQKILTVIVDDVEISQFRKSGDRTKTGCNLNQHLKTCDLTINSIACDINGTITDINNGINDLNNGIIRFVGNANKRINEDLIRMMRFVRFSCKQHNVDQQQIDQESINAIKLNSFKLNLISKQKIQSELLKILQYSNGIKMLIECDLLNKIFPEYNKCINMQGGENHNETVNNHLINSFERCCAITDNVLLRLTCFLHDIGKGYTFSTESLTEKYEPALNLIDEQSINPYESIDTLKYKIHFYNHDEMGYELMIHRLNYLKFSNNDINYITNLIKLHMYSYKSTPTKKSYIKFFNKLNKHNIPIEDYVMLLYCDHQSNLKKPRLKIGDFFKDNWLYEKYYELKYSDEPMTIKDLKISGYDIMKYKNNDGTNIKGKQIGTLLNYLFELVITGKIKNQFGELNIAINEKLKC